MIMIYGRRWIEVPSSHQKNAETHVVFLHHDSIQGLDSAICLPDFQFETILLPSSSLDPIASETPNFMNHYIHKRQRLVDPFRKLLRKLNLCHDVPPVTCVSDADFEFAAKVAREVSIPHIHFWPCSAATFLCWPFFGDQPMNCRYACNEWGIGIEISKDVKRHQVVQLVDEMMPQGQKSTEIKMKTFYRKNKAQEAADVEGSSFNNIQRLVQHIQHYNQVIV